jgi:hypothetical protein
MCKYQLLPELAFMDDTTNNRPVFIRESMAKEEQVREKTDKNGHVWVKVYVGGGAHFKRWLEECKELGDVEVEEIPPLDLQCYENAREKMYRIWMKKDSISKKA